ncbi:pseudouridine-5'-phosphate glycosidase [Roseivirga sp. BDSF3-8]|uniref:pseudouridine-5'-phosphate glycosidase n=1 Tax=Roseivirga sp. BDSF3-8 TaxID=3241598 RepID=UPI0035324432
MHLEPYLTCSPEVRDAAASANALVALESTIITHGMPYPQNVETARAVEAIIRSAGAVPATIALLNGRIHVGLTADELEQLGGEGKAIKVSRRDLPYVISKKMTGATTVSATMIAAEKAGIRVFVTGGIGGVHRGAEKTMDISADLRELSRTSVAVVSAGAKSILDIGLTLEYLETEGVPVLGWGTEEFPGFYSRTSGYKVNYRLDTPEEIAALLRSKWDMGLAGGVLIANPVPEADALPPDLVNAMVEEALQEAAKAGIMGKELTPYLLKAITDKTGGKSLQTNIALVKHNAEKGAALALALKTIKSHG